MPNRSVGRFQISRTIIEEEPWIARCVMSRCIILRAEMLYAEDAIEYWAISDMFEEVEPSFVTPFYEIIIDEITFGRRR